MKKGDYVLATKYSDGDPGDPFCVGFFDSTYDHFGESRHLVVDNEGKQFRFNGFRRVEKISDAEGHYLVAHMSEISARPMWLDIVNGEQKLCGDSLYDWLAKARAEISGSKP